MTDRDAALQDAAAAMCLYCAEGWTFSALPGPSDKLYHLRGIQVECHAKPIHDLRGTNVE